MKRILILSILFLAAVTAYAQPRYSIMPMPLCWTVGLQDSSITRYLLASSVGGYQTVLYLDAAGQEVIYTGGALRNGHCDCCEGSGTISGADAICRDTIEQAAHGFSVGDAIYWDGAAYANMEGNYGDSDYPIGIVTDSISGKDFMYASCGILETDFGRADGLWFATDTGLSLSPDTVEFPILKVYDGKSQVLAMPGLEFDATGKPLFDVVTVTGQRTINGGDVVDLHADSIRVSITIADTVATDVGHALELLNNNSAETPQTLSTSGDTLSISGGNSVILPIPSVDIGLNNLNDVTLTSPINNHWLRHNGTNWVNQLSPYWRSSTNLSLSPNYLSAGIGTGVRRVIIGVDSANGATGNNTVIVGSSNAPNLTSGAGVIIVGSHSGTSLAAGGNYPLIIGSSSATSTTTPTGFVSIGSLALLGHSNTANIVNIGYNTLSESTGSATNTVAIGGSVGTRSGSLTRVTVVGNEAMIQAVSQSPLYYTANNRTILGHAGGTRNSSDSDILIGTYAGWRSHTDNSVIVGVSAVNLNSPNSVLLGNSPVTVLDTAAAKTTTDLGNFNFTTKEITITGHGFGATGEAIPLLVNCASCPSGLVNNNYYNFHIVNANTFTSKENMLVGSSNGVVTFTPIVSTNNSISIGNSVTPKADIISIGRTTHTALEVNKYKFNIDQVLNDTTDKRPLVYNHSTGELEVYKTSVSGSTESTTDSLGDIIVTHNLGSNSFSANVTITGTTPRFVTVHSKTTTTFTMRVYDIAGAALNEVGVTYNWTANLIP